MSELSMLILTIGIIIAGIFGFVIYPNANTEYVEVEKTNIYSLETEAGSEGKFILGAGNIKNTASYFFYRETERGGMKLENILSKDATLFELENNEQPYVVVYENQYTNKLLRNWFKNDGYAYDVYVPQNTIKKEFDENVGE